MFKQVPLSRCLSSPSPALPAPKTAPARRRKAQCKFSDGKTITVDYSSPRMKGRKIFGELVPFGEVWRTGANEATTFVTTANVNGRRQECPGGQLYHLHSPQSRQLDTDHQQEDRRVGDSLQV